MSITFVFLGVECIHRGEKGDVRFPAVEVTKRCLWTPSSPISSNNKYSAHGSSQWSKGMWTCGPVDRSVGEVGMLKASKWADHLQRAQGEKKVGQNFVEGTQLKR